MINRSLVRTLTAFAVLTCLCAGSLAAQLRAPEFAASGSKIVIEIGTSDPIVEVCWGAGKVAVLSVGPSKQVSFEIPALSKGATVRITVGRETHQVTVR